MSTSTKCNLKYEKSPKDVLNSSNILESNVKEIERLREKLKWKGFLYSEGTKVSGKKVREEEI
jgi:hypothetical protein